MHACTHFSSEFEFSCTRQTEQHSMTAIICGAAVGRLYSRMYFNFMPAFVEYMVPNVELNILRFIKHACENISVSEQIVINEICVQG